MSELIPKAVNTRQIVLDTETTGLDPMLGHKIIEIGCVELVNRRLTGNHFHRYLQPDRAIDAEAVKVHGISNDFLHDKPRFGDIVGDFLAFVEGAELLIHNAAFDIGFLEHEMRSVRISRPMTDFCTVCDTLALARRLHPGQRNTLDALCKRYEVDNSQRTLHGALLDAEILADVYLAMTREQVALSLDAQIADTVLLEQSVRVRSDRLPLKVVRATADERAAHMDYLELLGKISGSPCLWTQLASVSAANVSTEND